ncbi:MAG: TPM domain-containing protein [Planctomycetota bacterium]
MSRSTNPREFLADDESEQVAEAIAEAERRTSAEVKVSIVRHCWTDVDSKARRTFHALGLDQTEQRNCVLILIVTTNREFAVFGDEGIHQKVGQGLWDAVRDAMTDRFREGAMGEGICEAVRVIGERLAEHFPYHAEDRDEIPDEVAYED